MKAFAPDELACDEVGSDMIARLLGKNPSDFGAQDFWRNPRESGFENLELSHVFF